jgi:hypothetical protein
MLAEEQKCNLDFLEWYGKTMPTVRGVPVVLGMTYEAVQFFNMVALKAMEPEEKKEEEVSACPTNQ